ncbi:MAG: SDR family NAD(P)-dependent oxidoreductase [Lachnospiraceae bacterium]|nr:SDR family NAD(P)-dependent oxidoreductase [Lachnospiraceae bacterium]
MNVIIITGASSGMGREFALQMDAGFTNVDEFWLIARRQDALEQLAKEMSHKVRILAMDVTDEYAMDDLEQLLYEEDVTVRVLVNCAGYGLIGKFEDLDMEGQLGMLTTNCEGLTRLTYLCLPYMRPNSRVINLASSAAFMPQSGFAVYAATKAYVMSLSRALNNELYKKHIYVTAVCPGPVDTAFFDIAEKGGEMLAIKKYVMATPEAVVDKALRDSYFKKEVSVYSLPMKLFWWWSKLVPHKLILLFLRGLR